MQSLQMVPEQEESPNNPAFPIHEIHENKKDFEFDPRKFSLGKSLYPLLQNRL